MNIKNILAVINSPFTDAQKRSLILKIIASDKNAINDILEMLAEERKQQAELILDANLELSRAILLIENNTTWRKKGLQPDFVLGCIKKFYEKWRIKTYFNTKTVKDEN